MNSPYEKEINNVVICIKIANKIFYIMYNKMLKDSLINLSEISAEIWGYKFFTALRETFSIISCIWHYNKIMAQKSVFHKISHLHVIKLIIWTTSPSPLLALGD